MIYDDNTLKNLTSYELLQHEMILKASLKKNVDLLLINQNPDITYQLAWEVQVGLDCIINVKRYLNKNKTYENKN